MNIPPLICFVKCMSPQIFGKQRGNRDFHCRCNCPIIPPSDCVALDLGTHPFFLTWSLLKVKVWTSMKMVRYGAHVPLFHLCYVSRSDQRQPTQVKLGLDIMGAQHWILPISHLCAKQKKSALLKVIQSLISMPSTNTLPL